MPLLPKNASYTATIGDVPLSGGRRATAQDFGAPGLGETGLVEAGHRVMSIAQKQLSDMEETEARQALVQSTEVRADYARRLDEAALSGADLGKLKEEMAGALTKIGDKFQTKRGAEQLQLYTANSATMFDQQANQIAVQRAWSTARLDGQKFVNGASALIQSNPAYLAVAEKDAADFVATFPGIRPDQRAELTERLKKDLNMAAAVSASRIDPDGAKKRLEAGEWDLTPEQRQTALNNAESYGNVKRAAEERETQRLRREQNDAADKARDGYAQRILSGDLGKKLERDIIADPVFATHPQYREHLVTFMRADAKRRSGEERKGDPKLMNDLWLQINSGQIHNPTVVVEAVKAHLDGKPGLDTRQADYLLGQLRGLRDGGDQTYRTVFAAEMRRQQAALSDDIMLSATPEGIRTREAIFAAIRGEAEAAAEKRRTSTAKGQDPADLFDPNHKDYFFTKKNIETIKARTVKAEQSADVDAALKAGAKRVTGVNDPVLREVKVGEVFVDENGNSRKMTEALRKRLGTTPAAAKSPSERDLWMQATGGTLAPGQTQDEAIAAWKKAR